MGLQISQRRSRLFFEYFGSQSRSHLDEAWSKLLIIGLNRDDIVRLYIKGFDYGPCTSKLLVLLHIFGLKFGTAYAL